LGELSDGQLVSTLKQAVEQGNWGARNEVITEFYNRYADNLATTWFWRTRDSDLSQEVLQETFTRAIAKLHTIADNQDVLIWLRTTARNHWLDRKRREGVEQRHAAELAEPSRAAGKPAEAGEQRLIRELDRAKTRSVFERYLSELRPQDREIMALRIRGAQMPEICARLGVSDKECRRAYARIRFLLQKMRMRGFTLLVNDLLAGMEGDAETTPGSSADTVTKLPECNDPTAN
jgi:RNA polymerase sigma-70 factor (ECF subfamily)